MIEYDPSIVGRVFSHSAPLRISAEMITGFCAAVGEAVSHDRDGRLVAPASIAVAFRDGDHVFQQLPHFGSRRLAAGMDVEFIAPIRAGDSITTTTRLAEIYEKTGRTGAIVFIVLRSTLTNQHGATVARVDHRFAVRP